jgi:hypothetical protein
VSFKEAVAELPDNFMWHILNFMDVLYKARTIFIAQGAGLPDGAFSYQKYQFG